MKKIISLIFMLGLVGFVQAEDMPLSIITDGYPHMEAIKSGAVKIPECAITYKTAPIKDITPTADVIEVNFLDYLKGYSSKEKHDWVLVPVYLWRSFPDQSVEKNKEEFLKTRVFPIRTVLALRAELAEQNPWLAEAIFIAFSEAKREALEKGIVPKPFGEETTEIMGKNYWSYGVKNNPKTLASLFKFALEQGFIKEDLKPDDVFAPEVLQIIDEKAAKN